MDKINYIKVNTKQNWTGDEPICINNLFLDEDWNKFLVIKTISSTIDVLSAYKEGLLSGNISSFVTNSFSSTFTDYISSFNNILDINHLKVYGISTIKINNNFIFQNKDQENLNENIYNVTFLSSTCSSILNTFNALTGEVNTITSIVLGNNNVTITNNQFRFGTFLDLDKNLIILSVNEQGGAIDILIGTKIGNNTYYNLDNDNNLELPTLTYNYFKKNESLTSAKISTGTEPNSIVNKEMCDELFRYAIELPANEELILTDVIDWICIIDLNHKFIQPTSVNLIDNTLKIKSLSSGTLFYIKKQD